MTSVIGPRFAMLVHTFTSCLTLLLLRTAASAAQGETPSARDSGSKCNGCYLSGYDYLRVGVVSHELSKSPVVSLLNTIG